MSKYKLIWSDEFDYTGKPDPSKWTFDVGGHGWGNNESQYYTTNDKNCYVKDGVLTITAHKEEFNGANYTSAKIHTNGKFSFQYGRVAVKAKLPKGNGTWPAIWLLGNNINSGKPWPLCGEIDVMEHVGRNPKNVFVTVHTAASNHRLNNQRIKSVIIDNCFDEFIEYAIDWKKDYIEFFIDDQQVALFDRKYISEGQAESGWPFDQPYYLLLNLAIGGTLGGEIDDLIFPAKYQIEYVRIYEIED